jgi:hypothetical protein
MDEPGGNADSTVRLNGSSDLDLCMLLGADAAGPLDQVAKTSSFPLLTAQLPETGSPPAEKRMELLLDKEQDGTCGLVVKE